MLKPTQMCLDDTMLSIADIAIKGEPIAEEFPWELFEPVREACEKARFERSKVRYQEEERGGQKEGGETSQVYAQTVPHIRGGP